MSSVLSQRDIQILKQCTAGCEFCPQHFGQYQLRATTGVPRFDLILETSGPNPEPEPKPDCRNRPILKVQVRCAGRPSSLKRYRIKKQLDRQILWMFLLSDLENEQLFSMWVNRMEGIFTIYDCGKLATFWGREKGKPRMPFAYVQRAIRAYYQTGHISKVPKSGKSHPIEYKFGDDIVTLCALRKYDVKALFKR